MDQLSVSSTVTVPAPQVVLSTVTEPQLLQCLHHGLSCQLLQCLHHGLSCQLLQCLHHGLSCQLLQCLHHRSSGTTNATFHAKMEFCRGNTISFNCCTSEEVTYHTLHNPLKPPNTQPQHQHPSFCTMPKQSPTGETQCCTYNLYTVSHFHIQSLFSRNFTRLLATVVRWYTHLV